MSLVAGAACAQTSQPDRKPTDKDVIAVVLGKKLTVKDKDRLDGLIFGALLEQFGSNRATGEQQGTATGATGEQQGRQQGTFIKV